jgi:hypothetical protein
MRVTHQLHHSKAAKATMVAIAWALLSSVSAFAQTAVTTQHNDSSRTGANLSETTLTTTNVNVSQFGKLYERAVDDEIYAQPLYVPGVNIAGTLHNVVYVATNSDSVYAFDADNATASTPLWRINYTNPAAGITPISHTDVGQACGTYVDFQNNIGITGTPVIDVGSQTMYFVTRTKENGTFVQRLHAIDIRDGSEKANSPKVIQATVVGTGDGRDANNNIAFNPRTENQRAALLLNNGVVYITWASYCDQGPYHGWIIGYDATGLNQLMVYNTSPDGGLGGIWQSGGGLSADASGNIYAITGNGTFNGNTGGQSFGNSFLKVSPTGSLLDWFTPFNWSFLNSTDEDLGIQNPMLIPNTNLVIGGGKEGVLYVVNTSNMGHVHANDNLQIVQSFQASSAARMNGSPVFWSGPTYGPSIYLWPAGDPLKVFRLSGGTFITPASAQSTALAAGGMPGGQLSISANGTQAGTGILWASMSNSGDANHAPQPGIVRAYDASDVTHELWNSQQQASRDALGNFSKFASPTVADGKVFMPTFSNKLVVYGLITPTGGNAAPVVNAGPDQTITLPASATLTGTASDDGNPVPPGQLTTTWSLLTGPAAVTINSPNALQTAVSFSAAGTYTFRLSAFDGQVTSVDDVVVIVNAPAGAGSGLLAQYYNDAGSGVFFTSLALSRTDPTVNFSWGAAAPASGVQTDNFSVRWSGQIQAPVSGSFTFTTTSDDGVRLWVNGQLIIDNWTDHGATDNSGAITLSAGTKYDIRMDYYEKGGDAVAKLSWAYPGQTIQIIPQIYLFPAPVVNQPPAVSAGSDQTITLPSTVTLNGTVQDDGLPSPANLTVTWSKISGREDSSGGTVTFANPHAAATTATIGASGTYVLRLSANDGAVTVSDDVTITVLDPPAGGTGTGLRADYFNDPGDGNHFITPALTRTDATVNFNWGAASPATGVNIDNFSVRWTGQVQAPVSGAFTFATTADDGVRLWVNGQLVIDNWVDQSATTRTSAAITLVAGTKYDVRMEYYEHGGDAVAELLWAYPGQAQIAIPKSQLYPAAGTATGLTAEYFNDSGNGTHFGTLVKTRVDSTVNFAWGTAAPMTGVNADNFSVRWTGWVQAPVSGAFKFSTVSDEGIRLWINGQSVINNWTAHGTTTNTSASVTLTAGVKYAVTLEYYDKTSTATAKLQWSYPGQATQIIPQTRLFQ